MENIKEREKKLIEMTDAFCLEYLNQEYMILCGKLIKKLARKREVPFKRGKLEIWAAAVIYTIGSINFLFDKSSEPYISSDLINQSFNTKKTTVSAKASKLKKLFDLWYFSPDFSTKEMEKSSPFNNMVMVDGIIVPMSNLPEETQQMIRQARSEGKDVEIVTVEE